MNHEHTSKLHRLRTLHLFAGAGGGILADILLGHQPVCAVEIEPYCQQVLHARQKDGFLPWFPIFDDVKTFDGKPWRGLVEVVAGGFPCQDISSAGKGAGIEGERSGLWGEMARVVCEVRPRYVFVENSPMLTIRGLGTVLRDLAAMGYDAKWCVLGACDAGAPHKRERIWILGYLADSPKLFCNGGDNHAGISIGRQVPESGNSSGAETMAAANSAQAHCECGGYGRHHVRGRVAVGSGAKSIQQENGEADADNADGCGKAMGDAVCRGLQKPEPQPLQEWPENRTIVGAFSSGSGWWATEPDVGRVANGVAHRVDRLKAIGNGQVPQCAALAWRILSEGII